MVSGGHKARAAEDVLFKAMHRDAPASAVQRYPRSVVIADRKAARYFDKRCCWNFSPDEATRRLIEKEFDPSTVENAFWDEILGTRGRLDTILRQFNWIPELSVR
jgi:hypothetical protein